MITGLPAYRPPVVEDVYCHCRRFYRVYVGSEEHRACFAEKIAQDIGAIFIDARSTPFYQCECGQSLDFTLEASLMIQ
jgi:hypothetical protein